MNTPEDTIAAIATAPGEGGVAIVRISGPRSLELADRVVSCPAPKPSARPSHTVVHGRIVDSRGRDLDEVLVLIMRAPHSYTGEDVVEIQGHGGNVAARQILRAVLDAGARLAEPGEFTKRAFLNGRIDLLQAEAVLDLVRAKSDRAAAAAVEQLEGSLSRQLNALYDSLMQATANLEATLDFPEDELPVDTTPKILAALVSSRSSFDVLISTWGEGHLIRDGALLVISGRPNVGKSTMLNTLIGKPRAIVSKHPGTTRDVIEDMMILDGIPVRVADTAGLRTSDCEVETEGIRRARELIANSDLQLYMVDASAPLGSDDLANLAALDPGRCIVVLNKSDLGTATQAKDLPSFACACTNLLNGQGVDEVRDAVRARLESGIDFSARPHAVVSERHHRILVDSRGELDAAIELLRKGDPADVVPAVDFLRAALEQLGGITGKTYHDELLSAVFSQFCIGK